ATAFGLLALADALTLDRRAHVLHETPQHEGACGDSRGVVLGLVEDELSRDLDVDLTGALQPPLQPLRRRLVLHTLAVGVGGAADRTERLVEIADRLLGEAARALLRRAGDALHLRPLDVAPLPPLHTIRPGPSAPASP